MTLVEIEAGLLKLMRDGKEQRAIEIERLRDGVVAAVDLLDRLPTDVVD